VTWLSLLLVVFVSQLSPLYSVLGGDKKCTYLPYVGSKPHYYASRTVWSDNGYFIIEHNYNRFIAEVIVFAYDPKHRHFVRTMLMRDGTYEIATSPGAIDGVWTWTTLALPDSPKPYRLRLRSTGELSYAFFYSNGPARGACRAAVSHAST
jgi:hypothetical protein